ncbi:MAG: BrnA antitoxin family protein [Alcaligenes faecalis]
MKTLKDLRNLDIDKVAKAIEAEAGHAVAGLRESLSEAKAGQFAGIHTPAQIVSRRRGRPIGSKQAVTKEAVKIRLDADVLAALRASGDGWQTRINDTLRASLALAGKVEG